MKRIITAFLAFTVIFYGNFSIALADGDTEDTVSSNSILAETVDITNAKGALLLEADTNKILYSRNANAKLPMASTTKIMTAILAIENLDLDSVVTVDDRASGIQGSSMYLGKGEKISVRNLIYGLMLTSGNDAAVELSILVAGSPEKFAELMNKKAVEIGALNTNFVNPNGLPVANHYTTAYDLAIIASYAMKNETFRKVVSTEYMKIPWEGKAWDRVLKNKNKILWQYEGGNGIKTGYTDAAGRCLVSSAKRDGMQLICVVLNCPDMFGDSMKILDYGFNNYERLKVYFSGQELGEVKVNEGTSNLFKATASCDIIVTIKKSDEDKIKTSVSLPSEIVAPIKNGQKIGSVKITLNDKTIAEEDVLYTGEEISKTDYNYYLNNILSKYLKGVF